MLTQEDNGKHRRHFKQLISYNVGGIRSSNGECDLCQGFVEHAAKPQGHGNAKRDACCWPASSEFEKQPANAVSLSESLW